MRLVLELEKDTVRKFGEVIKELAEDGKVRVTLRPPGRVEFEISDEAEEAIKKLFKPSFENYEKILQEVFTLINAVVTGRKRSLKEFIFESEDIPESKKVEIAEGLEEKFDIITALFTDTRVEKETKTKFKAILPVFGGLEWEIKKTEASSGVKKIESGKSAILGINTFVNLDMPYVYLGQGQNKLNFEVTLYDIEELLEELSKIKNKLKE